MAFVDNNGGLSAADVAAVTGNNSNGFGWGGDGSWWLLVLFLFAFSGNGWGGGFGGNSMLPYMMGNNTNNDVQRGFDQQAIMSGLTGITSAVSNGFASAEISRCNSQANLMQALNNIAMNQQNCCCENRAAIADLKYTIATEACADRAAVKDGVQTILDTMCQDKIDAKNERIAELQSQLTLANLAASQSAQTAAILAGQERQTTTLEQYLAPKANPAYLVQNPNCCPQNSYGCGCSFAA